MEGDTETFSIVRASKGIYARALIAIVTDYRDTLDKCGPLRR